MVLLLHWCGSCCLRVVTNTYSKYKSFAGTEYNNTAALTSSHSDQPAGSVYENYGFQEDNAPHSSSVSMKLFTDKIEHNNVQQLTFKLPLVHGPYSPSTSHLSLSL